MAENNVNMPSGFGGLMNFKDEYKSIFMLKPTHIIAFIMLIVTFRILLGVFLN